MKSPTAAEPAVTTDRGLPHAELRRVTAVLCATQIVSWGVLFYAFPVLASSIADDTGWSLASVVAAFTGAQLAAAGIGLLVGRRLHHHGPRGPMTLGSAVGVAALLLVAVAGPLPAFYAAWLLAGVAMGSTLYPPAFAALTAWGGERRVQALTVLTLVAGLASTVFAPLTAFLEGQLGWRTAYVVLACVLAAVVPLHWWGLDHPWPDHEAAEPVYGDEAAADGGSDARRPVPVWRTAPFIRMVASLSLVGLCIWSVVVLFVPLLVDRGISTQAAAIALGLGGVGQVCGRLGYRRLSAHTSVTARTRLVFGAVAATTLALALVPGPYVALVVISVLAGMARGVYTLIQATAVTDRWGVAQYAKLNAVVSGPMLVTGAFAPWIGAALAAWTGSYAASLAILTAVAVVGIAIAPAARIEAE